MLFLRHLARTYPSLVALCLAAVLALKLLIPAGFMPASDGHGISITICTGMGPVDTVLVVPSGGSHKPMPAQEKGSTCAFAGLSAPALATEGATPAAAALVVLTPPASSAQPRAPPVARPLLRPHSQGPPLTA